MILSRADIIELDVIFEVFRGEWVAVVRCMVRYKEFKCCPICGGSMLIRDHLWRRFIDGAGRRMLLFIRRLKCLKCGRIHRDLPDVVVPGCQHCMETHQAVAENRIDAVPCSDVVVGQLGRWMDAVGAWLYRGMRKKGDVALRWNAKEDCSPGVRSDFGTVLPGTKGMGWASALKALSGDAVDWLRVAVTDAVSFFGTMHRV